MFSKTQHTVDCRVSTAPRITENLMECNWSSQNFLANGTTEASVHKTLAAVQLFGK